MVPLSQVAALQGRQLGRSLAGVLSGAAANLRSRLAGIAAETAGPGGRISGPRGSPSPPLNKREERVSFYRVVSLFLFRIPIYQTSHLEVTDIKYSYLYVLVRHNSTNTLSFICFDCFLPFEPLGFIDRFLFFVLLLVIG